MSEQNIRITINRYVEARAVIGEDTMRRLCQVYGSVEDSWDEVVERTLLAGLDCPGHGEWQP